MQASCAKVSVRTVMIHV